MIKKKKVEKKDEYIDPTFRDEVNLKVKKYVYTILLFGSLFMLFLLFVNYYIVGFSKFGIFQIIFWFFILGLSLFKLKVEL